jgi:hypothetical protein
MPVARPIHTFFPLRVPSERLGHTSAESFVVSTGACLLVVSSMVLGSEQVLHWFLIPVLLCGILIGIDLVDWLRGRMDIFDPVGVVGLLGFHFFFLAPLLHVYWNYFFQPMMPAPEDWRPWLGAMAGLNFFGLLVYRSCRSLFSGSFRQNNIRQMWIVNPTAFFIVFVTAMAVSIGLQIWVYDRFGGMAGYISAYLDDPYSFRGWAPVFVLSESFPILAAIAYAFCARRRPGWRSLPAVLVFFAFFLAAKLFFGGLRGSRAQILFELFWAVGIVHFWVRPISKKIIALGLVLTLMFMYLYGFYKGTGSEALRALDGVEALSELEQRTQRTSKGVVLGDMGRSDVQAYLLYRFSSDHPDYKYAMGRTYLDALIYPTRFIWPGVRLGKLEWGTDLIFGPSWFIPFQPGRMSTYIYGLAGEAMLNFGPVAAPFVFAIFALAVVLVRRSLYLLPSGDARLIFVPFAVLFCVVMLAADLDNLIYLVLKQAAVPGACILLSSRKFRRAPFRGVGDTHG